MRPLQERLGMSWFMVASAALAALLHHATGAPRLTFGFPVDTREGDAFARVVGPCLNTVVVPSRCGADTTVGEFLEAVRDGVLDALEDRHYTLGGWSFGAAVAQEAARQLTDAGERVDVLLCLDGYAPDRKGRPVATDLAFLAAQLRLQADVLLGRGAFGAKLARAPRLRRVFLSRIRALLRHRPRPVPCPAVVLTASARPADAVRIRRALAPLHTSTEIRPVPGDHWSMLTAPQVGAVAREADRAIALHVHTDGTDGEPRP
ncbi:alpha/beta fold hydrolase [Streptomyces sp. BBFR102]|uniref:alpha/beta fold hydrolase n=1 Tax=Streptomyces sp. BBFR102 TaxID=3448171 RepID=UPI003F53C367